MSGGTLITPLAVGIAGVVLFAICVLAGAGDAAAAGGRNRAGGHVAAPSGSSAKGGGQGLDGAFGGVGREMRILALRAQPYHPFWGKLTATFRRSHFMRLMTTLALPFVLGPLAAQTPTAPVAIQGHWIDASDIVQDSSGWDHENDLLIGDNWTHLAIHTNYDAGELAFLFVHVHLEEHQPGETVVGAVGVVHPQLTSSPWTGQSLEDQDPTGALFTVDTESLAATLAIPPGRIKDFFALAGAPNISASYALAAAGLVGPVTNLATDSREERSAWGDPLSWTQHASIGNVIDVTKLLEDAITQANIAAYPALGTTEGEEIASYMTNELYLNADFQLLTVNASGGIKLKQPVHFRRRSIKSLVDLDEVQPVRYFPTLAGFWLHVVTPGLTMQVPFATPVSGLKAVWLAPGLPPVVEDQKEGTTDIAQFMVPNNLPATVQLTYFLDANGSAVWPKFNFASGAAATIYWPNN